MVLCPRCSFQNDDNATVCHGPDCSERLLKKEPVCRLHRLPEGAKICHICAAQASNRSGPQPVYDDPGTGRRKETSDLLDPQSAGFAPPKTPVNRLTEDEYLRKRDAAPVSPLARRDAHGIRPGVPINENPRRQTVSLHHDGDARPEPSGRNSERIVGFLVTYTWNPNGQIFPLRAGLSHIGAAPQCEISVPEDDAMSSMHASVQFRSKFLINDLDSENGTLVNDTRIDEVYVRLENYARIQTGRTVWTFLMIEPMRDA